MYKYVNKNYHEQGFYELVDDHRVYHYPKAEAILYRQADESILIKDYPFMERYVSSGFTVNSFIDRMLDGRQAIEIGDCIKVKINDVIDFAKEDIADNYDVLTEGEDKFDVWINDLISEIASAEIGNLIGKLNDTDGLSFKSEFAKGL